MTKVDIAYNPYKLETDISVDDEQLAENSRLRDRTAKGTRLQEWVEELPSILIEECNDDNFEISFHGTILDYEDLKAILDNGENEEFHISKLEHKPALEYGDKIKEIEKIFAEIQEGPFAELKTDAIKNAFEKAKSNEFQVCVVATMSAGKSTLVNALLGEKLMPSKQEACTAIITYIKDNDSMGEMWSAKVYDKEKQEIENYSTLDLDMMTKLNADKNVSEIHVCGNIPFVSSDDDALVLIDTPGPNNARNQEHYEIQSNFLSQASKSLVIYVMSGTSAGTNDDDNLLTRVAKSMEVGGKQSKDRFLFILNKMDERKKEDGELSNTLEKNKNYLEEHGIINPNLFPVAALPALSIRMLNKLDGIDDDLRDDLEDDAKVRKLNRNDDLHLEQYASIPQRLKDEINEKLELAKSADNKNQEALIHTGIISVEKAIEQYVCKYAKTAKIKNISDTFIHTVEALKYYETLKKQILEKTELNKKIKRELIDLQGKINELRCAKDFENEINKKLEAVDKNLDASMKEVRKNFQNKIRTKMKQYDAKTKIDISRKEYEIKSLTDYVEKKLEPAFYTELKDIISSQLVDTGNALLEEYKKKLKTLKGEFNFNSITVNPLEMAEGMISSIEIDLNGLISHERRYAGTQRVKVGSHKVSDSHWYFPWTWGDYHYEADYEYRDKYETVAYIDGAILAQKYLAPVEEQIGKRIKDAEKYSKQQASKIKTDFIERFNKINEVLKAKVGELENLTNTSNNTKKELEDVKKKEQWLNKIQKEIDGVLSI